MSRSRRTEVTKTEARRAPPRQMVSVLSVSLALAVVAGVVLILWFYILGAAARLANVSTRERAK